MQFQNVACLGAGLIGGSWSTLFALKGANVTLYDLRENAAEQAVEKMEADLDLLVQERVIDEQRKRATMSNLHVASSLEEATADAEYIQESVAEDYRAKKEVFSRLDRLTSSRVILASSTSGLLMSEIQRATAKPERCITVHPWNPPHIMPLVEIVPGRKTSRDTVERVRGFMCELGRTPVVLRKEIPGFIGNRLSAALWREAVSLVNSGVASIEDIDKVLYAGPGLRWAIMGPFMTYHLGGGEGGIQGFISGIGQTFSSYWRTMDTWTSIPKEAIERVVKEMDEAVGKRRLDELIELRNRKLLSLLRMLHPSTFR